MQHVFNYIPIVYGFMGEKSDQGQYFPPNHLSSHSFLFYLQVQVILINPDVVVLFPGRV